jgi:hypothetical protein
LGAAIIKVVIIATVNAYFGEWAVFGEYDNGGEI